MTLPFRSRSQYCLQNIHDETLQDPFGKIIAPPKKFLKILYDYGIVFQRNFEKNLQLLRINYLKIHDYRSVSPAKKFFKISTITGLTVFQRRSLEIPRL